MDYYNDLIKTTIKNKMSVDDVLKKYPLADKKTVKDYYDEHVLGATILQLQQDANKYKWNKDTLKAIYYLMSNLQRNLKLVKSEK